jgi:hypothetical protein
MIDLQVGSQQSCLNLKSSKNEKAEKGSATARAVNSNRPCATVPSRPHRKMGDAALATKQQAPHMDTRRTRGQHAIFPCTLCADQFALAFGLKSSASQGLLSGKARNSNCIPAGIQCETAQPALWTCGRKYTTYSIPKQSTLDVYREQSTPWEDPPQKLTGSACSWPRPEDTHSVVSGRVSADATWHAKTWDRPGQ